MHQGDGKAYVVDQTDSDYISIMSREPSNSNLSAMQYVHTPLGGYSNSQSDLSPANNIQKYV
jgi:hypothetical protein